MVGLHVPFVEGGKLFKRLTGIAVSDNGLRAATEQIGSERAAAEAEQVTTACDPQRLKLPAGPAHPSQRLYGSLDETSVRTQEGWRKAELDFSENTTVCLSKRPFWSGGEKRNKGCANMSQASENCIHGTKNNSWPCFGGLLSVFSRFCCCFPLITMHAAQIDHQGRPVEEHPGPCQPPDSLPHWLTTTGMYSFTGL